ncbi:hypothetical protein CH281_18250 [Rhodococcus sp. 06-221-2]|nr:hypothetical protein CH281_18250 [Rhodococcus sp. 06-221-2]
MGDRNRYGEVGDLPRTQAADVSAFPRQYRIGDGVVNRYEQCGLACGQEPTTGDLQIESGCEAGYITGPLCDRIEG